MKQYVIILITFMLLMFLGSPIIYLLSLPSNSKDVDNLITSRDEYLKRVYTLPTDGPHPSTLINDKNINWLWDTAPASMLDAVPIANNLLIGPQRKGKDLR